MDLKIIGIIFVITACGRIGYIVADLKKKEIGYLRYLIHALEQMKCELGYRMTPLPQLCRTVGTGRTDLIGRWFLRLGEMLDQKGSPDIQSCTKEVMALIPTYHPHISMALTMLCQSLGRYDLTGQLEGLDAVLDRCQTELGYLSEGIDQNLRTIRTLSLCAGTAIAIVLL